jgi:hypothetical protein
MHLLIDWFIVVLFAWQHLLIDWFIVVLFSWQHLLIDWFMAVLFPWQHLMHIQNENKFQQYEKNYGQIREECDNQEQQLSTAARKEWRVESRTKNLAFCSIYIVYTLFCCCKICKSGLKYAGSVSFSKYLSPLPPPCGPQSGFLYLSLVVIGVPSQWRIVML